MYCGLSSSLGNDDCHGRTDANAVYHFSWFFAFSAATADDPIHASNMSDHLLVRDFPLLLETGTLPKIIFFYMFCFFFLAHGQNIP